LQLSTLVVPVHSWHPSPHLKIYSFIIEYPEAGVVHFVASEQAVHPVI
jgi:hypothetical protein